MARVDGTDDDARTGAGAHAGVSDARLTDLLRADTATAYPALRELRARHSPSLLAYARLCTAGESSARQLAAHAFTQAAREIGRGTDAGTPLRHRLLLLAGESARNWAADDRSGALDPGLLLVLNTAGPKGPVPPLLTAFRNLSPRAQGLVWYGVVEQESTDRTAVLLGVNREDVVRGTPAALWTLARSCLRSRLAGSDDPRCADLLRLIEESVRQGGPGDSADLHTHMARCPHCIAGYEEQCALRDNPRTTLAEGLLPWAGTAYARGRGPVPPMPAIRASDAVWPASRRFALASAALGVALAPLLLFLLNSGAPDQEPVGTGGGPSSPPPVTVTATVPVSPTASPSTSPSPSVSATSRSPSPSKSPAPTRTARPGPTPKPPAPAHPPGATYAQVVNAATGLCLDIRDGYVERGTDVVTAPCSSSPTQRWRVDAGRGVVQSYADPGYCLDSRGSVERGVGIWECASVDGSNGLNLRFAVDHEGRIRPAIAFDTAAAPDAYGVALRPLDGGSAQRWRAGAR
ncbi:RICIN domain-containing protein [Streptomyces sp. DH24]|uniref:RICIN domain-containing protein n=1 Tax=Streptomyces sp. DH24 TaxID=3040123 RepID=UPI0024428CCB|nr:RICIN domain-containing protein [Streptomyces sp. DH24]MDG9719088.1 RICIN domain-containing protein [Streptomyces sp. DH24]